MPDIVVKQNGETVRVTVATGPRGPQGPAGPQGLPGPNSVPTDVAVAALVSTPGTDTEEALRGTFVRFVDQDGDPLPAGSITTIHVNTVTGEIDDITFEEA